MLCGFRFSKEKYDKDLCNLYVPRHKELKIQYKISLDLYSLLFYIHTWMWFNKMTSTQPVCLALPSPLAPLPKSTPIPVMFVSPSRLRLKPSTHSDMFLRLETLDGGGDELPSASRITRRILECSPAQAYGAITALE
jgi:hypothetical protein